MQLSSGTSAVVLLTLFLLKTASTFNLDVEYPIVFEDPTPDPGRSTYFGYTVLLHASGDSPWIMIGAPRANSSYPGHAEINEPGVVYKCSLFQSRTICDPMLLDPKGNGFEHNIWDLRNGSLIGASMDVQPGYKGRVVICAPRWIDPSDKLSNEYNPLGACYWLYADDPVDTIAEKLIPLAVHDRRYIQVNGHTLFDLGIGQCGISSHMPLKKGIEEGSEILLGAPGVMNWMGAPVLYEDDDIGMGGVQRRAVSIKDFTIRYVPVKDSKSFVKQFDYFGYQVNSGYFFKENELWYVAGAPRASGVLGKVFIFKVKKDRYSRRDYGLLWIIKNATITKNGIQCGEYFGASIAVGTVNGDDLEDLIIGAPFYTSDDGAKSDGGYSYDEGRISIFFGDSSTKMEEVIIYGKVPGGRFGTAVSYLGDLDSDGFGEIAVGAPYEDHGRGAVYIYSGTKDGIVAEAVQRLSARDTYQHLRGFGFSISTHSADVDGNKCLDIAVGAYKSGHAVLYRGRPVVKWDVNNKETKIRSIPRNATEFTVHGVCITYYGNSAPQKLVVWRTVDMDPTYKRCHIGNETSYNDEITLSKGEPHCSNLQISLKESKARNIIEPIDIKIKYQLPEEKLIENGRPRFQSLPLVIRANGSEGTDGFDSKRPISRSSPTTSITASFEVGCGSDEVCLADLQISGSLPQLNYSDGAMSPSFVIGSSKTLKLLVRVKNTGEPAYSTIAYIKLGFPARIARIPPECYEFDVLPYMNSVNQDYGMDSIASDVNSLDNGNETHGHHREVRDINGYSGMNTSYINVICDFGNPLQTNSVRENILEIDMKSVHGSQEMHLAAFVETFSNDTSLSNKIWSMTLPFSYEADMEINGRAGKIDLFPYFKENKNISESNINFHHIYEVQKYGHSPVQEIDIILQIPVYISGRGVSGEVGFLKILLYEGSQSGQSFPCSIMDDTEDQMEYQPHYGQAGTNDGSHEPPTANNSHSQALHGMSLAGDSPPTVRQKTLPWGYNSRGSSHHRRNRGKKI